jgi:hypothetical protein
VTIVAERPVAPSAARPGLAPPERRRVSRRHDLAKIAISLGISAMPLLVPAGPGNTAPADVFLLVAVVVSALWLAGRQQPMRFPYVFPMGLSILAGALASTVAYAHAYVSVGGGLITLLQDMFVLIWAIMIANLGRDPRMLKTITRAWAISVVCAACLMTIGVMSHISLLSGETPRNGVRAAFTLGDPNLAANYFIVGLLMLRAARFPRRRSARGLCCALVVTAIALTGSNGGAIVLVVSTLLGGLFRLAQRRGAVPATIAASAVILAMLAVASQIHVQPIVQKAQQSSQLLRDSIGRQAESSGSRSTILAESERLYLTGDTPLGIGPGGTKGAFRSHNFSYVKMAHDDYTAALVERGWLGAFALICLLVIVAARCRRISAGRLRSEYAAIIPRPELLAAAVLAMAISAWLYQVLHFRHLWALLGVVAAMELWGRRAGRQGIDRSAQAVNR